MPLPKFGEDQRNVLADIRMWRGVVAKAVDRQAKLRNMLTQVLPGILEHIDVAVEVGGRHPKYVLSVRSDTDAVVSYSYPCAPLAELLTRLKALLDTAAGSGPPIMPAELQLPEEYVEAQEAAANRYRSPVVRMALVELSSIHQLLTADPRLDKEHVALLAAASLMVKNVIQQIADAEKGMVRAILASSKSGKSFVTSVIYLYLQLDRWAYERHPFPDNMALLYRDALLTWGTQSSSLDSVSGDDKEREELRAGRKAAALPLRVAMPPTYGQGWKDANSLPLLQKFHDHLRGYCREGRKACFQPSIPSRNNECFATTQRTLQLSWSPYLHILVSFKTEEAVRRECSEFLSLLEKWARDEATLEDAENVEEAMTAIIKTLRDTGLRTALDDTSFCNKDSEQTKRMACFQRYLAFTNGCLPLEETALPDGTVKLSIVTDPNSDKLQLHTDVLLAVQVAAIVFHGPERPPPGTQWDPKVQTEGLLDQLLLWVLNVLSLLNSTDGEQTPEQQSPNAPAPPPPITDFLPAELKQVKDWWRLVLAIDDDSPILFGPFSSLANGSCALDMPGLADDAHQMDVLIKALEERVTSLIIMGPESISAEVMKFAGEHYVPRVLDSLLEWESSKDLRGVLHTSLMLYPEKVGRTIQDQDQRISLEVMQRHLPWMKEVDRRLKEKLSGTYTNHLKRDWGRSWRTSRLQQGPSDRATQSALDKALANAASPPAGVAYPTLEASMALNTPFCEEQDAAARQAPDRLCGVRAVGDYISTRRLLHDMYGTPVKLLEGLVSGLRDNMQSEQMGLIKLNDTSVKNMASNLAKLKQSVRKESGRTEACKGASEKVKEFCDVTATAPLLSDINRLLNSFEERSGLAFRRDLEKVIDEAVNASVEKIEKAEGPRFTVQVMRTCLLTITKGNDPYLDLHRLVCSLLGLDQLALSLMRSVHQQVEAFKEDIADQLASAAMASAGLPQEGLQGSFEWMHDALSNHVKAALAVHATYSLFLYNRKGFHLRQLRPMLATAVRDSLQGVLRNALRKVDEPPEAAGLSGAATGVPAAAAVQSATATTAQSPSTASPAGKRRKPRSRSKAAEAEDRLPLFTERLKAVLVSELRRALPETWNAIRRELLDVARNLLQGLGDRLVKAEGNGPEAPQKSAKSKLGHLFSQVLAHLAGLLQLLQRQDIKRRSKELLTKALSRLDKLVVALGDEYKLESLASGIDPGRGAGLGVVTGAVLQDNVVPAMPQDKQAWLRGLQASWDAMCSKSKAPARPDTRSRTKAQQPVADAAHANLDRFVKDNGLRRVENRANGNCMLESVLQASQNAETRPSNGDVQRLRSAAVAAVLRTYYWDDEFRVLVEAQLHDTSYNSIWAWQEGMEQDRTWGDGILLLGIAIELGACILVQQVGTAQHPELPAPIMFDPSWVLGQTQGVDMPTVVLVHLSCAGRGQANHYEACIQEPIDLLDLTNENDSDDGDGDGAGCSAKPARRATSQEPERFARIDISSSDEGDEGEAEDEDTDAMSSGGRAPEAEASLGGWVAATAPRLEQEANTTASDAGCEERVTKRARTESTGSMPLPTTLRLEIVLDGSLLQEDPVVLHQALEFIQQKASASSHWRVHVPRQLAVRVQAAGEGAAPGGATSLHALLFPETAQAQSTVRIVSLESSTRDSYTELCRLKVTPTEAFQLMGLQAARKCISNMPRTRSQANSVHLLLVAKVFCHSGKASARQLPQQSRSSKAEVLVVPAHQFVQHVVPGKLEVQDLVAMCRQAHCVQAGNAPLFEFMSMGET